MAHTPLFQRLLKLTSLAQKARQQGTDETELAEQHFYSRRKFLQSSAMATAAVALASCSKLVESPAVNSGNGLNPGITTELGGEFIDTGHYEMRALARYFGLPLLDVYNAGELELTQNIYYFNNTAYTDGDFLKAIAPYLPRINRDVNSLSYII